MVCEICKQDGVKTILYPQGSTAVNLCRDCFSKWQVAQPSQVSALEWIYAGRKVGSYPKSQGLGGKWLVFVGIENLDEVWAKIKEATEKGRLGGSSKTATAKPNPNATDKNTKVICVYTYDWTDEQDVRRVREELRKLGVTNKISYKTTEDTLSGKYRVTGHTGISKYYE